MNWRTARAGDQVVAGIGLSTIYPDFDFETYSEGGYRWTKNAKNGLLKLASLPGLADQNRGLGAVGTRNYVQHPTFELLSLAYNLKDGSPAEWWRPDPSIPYYPHYCEETAHLHPHRLLQFVAAGGVIEAWGAMFEWQVWEFHCVPVLGWPRLHQEQMRDAPSKSRASGYPGKLEIAGNVLDLEEKKDAAGSKLIRKLTVPRNPTKGNPALRWTPFTAAEDFQRFYEYNKQDPITESNASALLPDLTPRELEIWKMDFRVNMRGMQIDMAAVEDCITIVEQAEQRYNSELRTLTGGKVESSSKVKSMLDWMRSRGVTLYELDEETIEEALKRTDYPANVLRVLRIRQILAFGSVKKLYAMRAQTTREGRLCEQYVYYGAHTSLWNGRGVQPANLYKGIFDKPEQVERALQVIRSRCLELLEYEFHPHDGLEIIASCLRSMIIAAPGHRLISADFTAIQAVATSCMANELWRIEVFRTHGKIYEAQAAKLTGKTLEYYLEYRDREKKHHEDRQLGKLAILSADFGAWIGGWKRFGAEKYGDDKFIKDLILKTRNAMPNIVNFWGGQTVNKFRDNEEQLLHGLEGAAVSAILEPGKCFSSNPNAKLAVHYQVYEDTLYCRPPSGGYIRYHAPRLQKSMRPYASAWEYVISYEGWNSNQSKKGGKGWVRMDLYSGILIQNVISNMCREIQANALLALDRNGYPIVMHTHDEGAAEVPNGVGSIAGYMAAVRGSLPAWAVCEDGQPWPIKVPDAWESTRYGKWD